MMARLAFLALHLLLVVGVTLACAGSAGGSGWIRALLILPALASLLPLPFALLADTRGDARRAKTLLYSVLLSLPVSVVLLLVLLLLRRLDNAGWH